MPSAVIFDMDGVIVDSEWLHQRTEIEALSAAGVEITRENLLAYTGMTLLEAFRGIKDDRGAAFDPETVAERKRATYLARLDELEPIDGAVETVRRIGGGYDTALASSSHRRVVDAVVEMLDLETAFETTLSGDEVENGKPDPEMFQRAANALDVAPAEAVVVEDSRNGVEAALAGGFYTIGFQSASEIDLSAADHLATSMAQVEQVVERIDGTR